MSRTVSNDSASATEEVLETPQSLDEAIETGFLPDDEHYRLTGEFKSEKPDDSAASKEKPAAKEGDAPPASEQDDASKAAASAPAQTQRTEPRRESRWEKRERELKALREENTRLKSGAPRSESQQASQPAAETQPQAQTQAAAEPQINDVDAKTGKPKFATLTDYLKAHGEWNRNEALRQFREESAKTQQQQEFAAIDRSRAENVEKVRAAHPDYDQIVEGALAAKEADGRATIFYTVGSHIDNFLLSQPDRGAGLLYHCMKNASDPAIRAIFARTPDGTHYQLTNIEQISRLAVLSHSLGGKNGSRPSQVESDSEETSSARPVTRASRPPHQVSGQGTVAKDAVEQALEDGDFETYQRAQNAKELARLKRK